MQKVKIQWDSPLRYYTLFALKNGECITPRQIVKAAGITDVTLRIRIRDVKEK
jgi:transcription initiation factor TFIIIB Brf1 subunit/transcription initiation factor TFIIB